MELKSSVHNVITTESPPEIWVCRFRSKQDVVRHNTLIAWNPSMIYSLRNCVIFKNSFTLSQLVTTCTILTIFQHATTFVIIVVACSFLADLGSELLMFTCSNNQEVASDFLPVVSPLPTGLLKSPQILYRTMADIFPPLLTTPK